MKQSEYNNETYLSLPIRYDSYCKGLLSNLVHNVVDKQANRLKKEYLMDDYAYEMIVGEEDVGDRVAEVCLSVEGHEVKIHNPELAEALLKLQERKRQVVLLSEFIGYSLHEISEMLGLTYETVKSTKSKAIRDIRKGKRGGKNEKKEKSVSSS